MRFYVGLFNSESYVRGLRKWLIYHRSTKIPESQAEPLPKTVRKTLVLFEGLGDLSNLFKPLLPHQQLLSSRLYEILSTNSHKAIESHAIDYEIAVHIRKGDKPPISIDEPPPPTQWGWTLPNIWYINVIKSVRAILGRDAPVRIFSDGRPEQLADVLALPNTRLSPANTAIVDMFLLSRAKILITSPTSTFSWWSAFLGQMPTISYAPWKQRLHSNRTDYDIASSLTGQIEEGAEALRVAV